MTCTYNVSDLPERIASKIEVDANGCWLWTAHKNASGYGTVSMSLRSCLAHRVIYKLLVGTIPDDLQTDHLCRVRNCCNPAHLELVTLQENVRRGEAGKRNAIKTHCLRGHPLEGENLIPCRTKQRKRGCVTCNREYDRERAAKRRAARKQQPEVQS